MGQGLGNTQISLKRSFSIFFFFWWLLLRREEPIRSRRQVLDKDAEDLFLLNSFPQIETLECWWRGGREGNSSNKLRYLQLVKDLHFEKRG